MPRLSEIGEVEVLRRLIATRRDANGVVVAPGDDAAVLAPTAGHDLVVTTDSQVEGRHFLPEWLGPAARGVRLATANLSDLAAMAAEPRWALLSLGVRVGHPLDALLDLQRGVDETLARFGAAIVGGNLTAVEGPEWYDLTLIGEAAPGKAWTRAGARPGDLIAVSGFPGRAGAGLRLALRLGEAARQPEWAEVTEAWRAPVARIELARALLATDAVRAAIDVSDGLGGDLEHLAAASGVAVAADVASLPADPVLERAAAALEMEPAALRLGASDDYELLLAVDAAAREPVAQAAGRIGVALHFIGRAIAGSGVTWRGSPSRPIAGFDHFSG